MGGEKVDDLSGIFHVTCHPDPQGLNSLHDMEGGCRTHTSAHITKALFTGTLNEGSRPKLLAENEIVEPRIGLRERGEFSRCIPVESPAINQQAANDNAMAAQKFGGRVHDDVGTKHEGFDQVGCRKG